MRKKKKVFVQGAVQHVYQRTHNYGLIFYTLEDYLLFFTIFCTTVRRMKVEILGLCLMINHIHLLVSCEDSKTLSEFVGIYSLRFVKEYNRWKKRTGPLFVKSFGCANKVGAKKIMTAIAYLGNNPTVKKLCSKAEDYQWSLIPYARCRNPFSSKIVIRRSSYYLKKAVYLVRICVKKNMCLNYQIMNRLFKDLDYMEKSQLIDYIISAYNVINYNNVVKYYGNYDTMLMAINSNSGSEYDIEEECDFSSDKVFAEMISIAGKAGYGGTDGYNFQNMPRSAMRNLAYMFLRQTKASKKQIAKFLHVSERSIKGMI